MPYFTPVIWERYDKTGIDIVKMPFYNAVKTKKHLYGCVDVRH